MDCHLKNNLSISSNYFYQMYMRKDYSASDLIMLWDNTGKQIVKLQWMATTSKLYAYRNGGGMDLVEDLDYNTFYKIDITPDFDNGIYSVYIDDSIKTIGTNTTPLFHESTTGNTAYAWIQASVNSAHLYVDECKVLLPNSPPVANAGSDRSSESHTNLTFDGSNSYDSDGSITNWSWSMGDGTTLYGESVTHQYTDDGTYTVTLTVTDDSNATDTDNLTATITDKYPYWGYLLFFIFMFIMIVVLAIVNWVTG